MNDQGLIPVRVQGVRRAAEGVAAFDLVREDGEPFPRWAPGAHIDVVIAEGLERQYSLCGDPADATTWTIAVLREPESRGGSRRLHDEVTEGTRLAVRGPRNEFPLAAGRRHLLVAGGIGITPLLPMVRELAAAGADWRLVYGGRQAASMAFTDDLAAFGDRVTLWPEDKLGLIDLDALLGEPADGVKVYCCGPGALIDAVEARCAAWPPGTLHVERFRPREGALDGERTGFQVHLRASGLTLDVGPEQSIADVIEAAGVDVLTSCREGTCGTCETTVLDGVPDHRDSLLTAAEKAANDTVMICCSRSRTPLLVLDL
ncbi:PDR/VanB family oxidoreductase [Yinghuangia sp. ASG 101]|uniref:PDR/VanB family oxidoreductase n=1 Tax=Yinghuangia sp. ASG 101 TaxID=2896848 RepID=UPI001E5ECEDE|nr:PDR/VanB family oxidoreductase [Yinghuangia sp. ASG 101]UGQ15652.1 PDR/VanB family oxidoreductase [Yinghuangia sp. ASG 101]